MNKEFEWTVFYTEFANVLSGYAANRNGLIARLQNCYKNVAMSFPKMDYDEQVRDIDPFTVFGLFNKGISNKSRIKLLTAIKDEFGIKAAVPERFHGIPILNNMMSCFFAYSNDPRRGDNDIQNLWRMYDVAIAVADGNISRRGEFIDVWNTVVAQYAVKWNLTMGLYWIRPEFFVNLDSVNRDYINNDSSLANVINDIAPKVLTGRAMPTGVQYMGICEAVLKAISEKRIASASLPEFSYNAWKMSQDSVPVAGLETDANGRRIWLCAPGRGGCAWDECKENGFICLGWDEIGDLSRFANRQAIHKKLLEMRGEGERNPTNASLACWQFANEIRPNDVIVAKSGLHKILGVGVVTGTYKRDESRDDLKNVIPCKWLVVGEKTYADQLPMKTLTNISGYPDVVHTIFTSYGIDPDTLDRVEVIKPLVIEGEEYSKEDFLSEVFMTSEEYDRIVRIIETKKNIVFQGAPGVGKTYAAKRFAASLVGFKNSQKVEFVQFHQNYSYEDFIGGYKPDGNGFKYVEGVFYKFCQQAKTDSQGKYVFIIDEINRGNLSKIFGELLMLIEADKRNEDISLAYTREPFFVPDNVYIIGMMNTADRSLAMIDYALRRRFSFISMRPQFGNEKFKALLAQNQDPKIGALISAVVQLNDAIRSDSGLGEGFEIGHSYFCSKMTAADIVEFELKPLLKEYWYDDPDKVDEWNRNLDNAVK